MRFKKTALLIVLGLFLFSSVGKTQTFNNNAAEIRESLAHNVLRFVNNGSEDETDDPNEIFGLLYWTSNNDGLGSLHPASPLN